MPDRQDPALMAWLDGAVPRLERICYSIRKGGDQAFFGLGVTPDDLNWFRNDIPRLGFILRTLLQQPSTVDAADLDVSARIQKYTALEYAGCSRWIGAVVGQHKSAPGYKGEGGTPAVSYRGKMVPARRLAWQLLHKGTDQELAPDERLHNIGCREKSLCMNLNHWRKAPKRPDLGPVREALASLPPSPDGWLCGSGHLNPPSRKYCQSCRAASENRRINETDMAERAGRALRQDFERLREIEA